MTQPDYEGHPQAPSIETFTGRFIEIENPQAKDIDLLDIAHGLANCCRFAGQCKRFYSVAEHSLLVHDLVREKNQSRVMTLTALLHDAHEAYLGDLTTPFKQCLGTKYYEIVMKWDNAIALALDLPRLGKQGESHALLVDADHKAAMIEAWALMPSRGEGWVLGAFDGVFPPGVQWYGGLDVRTAEARFAMELRRYFPQA